MKKSIAFLILLSIMFFSACAVENKSSLTSETPIPSQKVGELPETIPESIKVNPILDAIDSEGQICAKDFGVSKRILGVYFNGNNILAEEDGLYYWYSLNNEIYSQEDIINKNIGENDILVISVNADEKQSHTVKIPKSDHVFFPRIINVIDDRAIIQTVSEDQLNHYNYEVDLASGQVVEITYAHNLEKEESRKKKWETCIALPNELTLSHFFILGSTADDSYSVWLVIDSSGNVISRFTTQYFDDIDNICVDKEGKAICFTYGQTSSRPHILSIEDESVHSIFDDTEFYGYDAVTFMSWVNEDTLALGYRKDGEHIIKFTKPVFN